ncbi:putative bifunctional diguanylate cyclase/phosphodiesterase [Parerythrobacter aestuarii]|uniref:putative bifunctional diguanylate cyclase/phosphodiesterase n=1 Tax=Parerythrobacter aestuarii TaxID=3020909 RepID=UPI0024DE40BC|nr:EAL domain-containing protein [Parerythrobacter aestuarii]
MDRKTGRDAINDRVRRTLVRTLYTQPTSLAIGALNGVVSGSIAAYIIDDLLFTGFVVLFSLVGIARVITASMLSPDNTANTTRKLELFYEAGAFSYAFLYGAIGALTLLYHPGSAVEILIVANALCYGIGVSARNAGSPIIANGQLVLTFLPILIACLVIGSLPLVVLAVTMVLVAPAMASITHNVHQVLRESIAAAENSERMAKKMETLAHTDVVTGLTNRAGLNHLLVEAMMDVPQDTMLAMFWLDLDRFKEVNDLLGHQIGDRVLNEMAVRLRDIMPEDAIVARFGGDEFTVVAKIDDRRHAERLASEVHADLMRPIRLDGDRLEVGASIGVALLPDDGTDADTLMQNADLALYHAKVNGRKQTQFYDSSMSRNLARKREIEAELRAAIQKDELSIFFQPIVDLETGRIKTFEALVRWFHPEKGELRPDEFIPVAEDSGLIVTLGNWITVQAAKAAAKWPEEVTLAVNLSPLQIKAPGASLGIFNALREAKLAPERLELEVTESLFVDDSEATELFISELSAKGVRFALDDFGTGYSSLAYIQKYPFSKVKIDRSFVSGPDVGKKTEAIIRAVAEMGAQLDMSIVAEGLEEIEQVKAVREAGCTLGQGYYFSRAVPDYLAAMLLAQERESDEALRKVG